MTDLFVLIFYMVFHNKADSAEANCLLTSIKCFNYMFVCILEMTKIAVCCEYMCDIIIIVITNAFSCKLK